MTDSEFLHLPLFLGMSSAELSILKVEDGVSVCSATKGTEIVAPSERCDKLLIVAKGSVKVTTMSTDRSYSIDEILHAPLVLQPERLFGLKQRYSTSVVTISFCEMVVVEKPVVLRMMEKSMVFRLNLLNILTALSQKLIDQTWHQQSEDVRKRLVRFVKDRVTYPAGQKKVCIKMTTMARELGCSRLEVSDALHYYEDHELLIIRREKIEIPMLQLLLAHEIDK